MRTPPRSISALLDTLHARGVEFGFKVEEDGSEYVLDVSFFPLLEKKVDEDTGDYAVKLLGWAPLEADPGLSAALADVVEEISAVKVSAALERVGRLGESRVLLTAGSGDPLPPVFSAYDEWPAYVIAGLGADLQLLAGKALGPDEVFSTVERFAGEGFVREKIGWGLLSVGESGAAVIGYGIPMPAELSGDGIRAISRSERILVGDSRLETVRLSAGSTELEGVEILSLVSRRSGAVVVAMRSGDRSAAVFFAPSHLITSDPGVDDRIHVGVSGEELVVYSDGGFAFDLVTLEPTRRILRGETREIRSTQDVAAMTLDGEWTPVS